MKILSIIGTYRKGKTIDTLVSKAIEGARAKTKNVVVDTVYLIDKRIEYCKNCMVCRKDDENKNVADCVISDDMEIIYPMIEIADGFIFGTPVNMGAVTAVMKTFLERATWVFGKPGKYPIKGCPVPRSAKKKKAIIINFIVALTIVFGGVVGYFISKLVSDATTILLPFAAGGFIYIAATDLVPEIKKELDFKKYMGTLLVFILGILIMYMIRLAFHG